jgi:DNA-binding CsgD family transcriptional regulator
VQLLVALATALAGAGQLEASRDVLAQLLGRLAHGHPARIPVVAFCAGVEHLLGRHRAADARLTEALGQLTDGQSAEAVQLKLELAAGHGYQNRAEEMLAAAEEALAGATALREPALAVAALGQIALARYFLGLPAGDAIEQAAAAMDALDDAALAGRLDLGLWIGWSEAVLERHERSIEHCLRVIEVAHATGQGAPLLVTRTAQAWSLIRLGRLEEAEEVLSAVIEAGRLAPNLFLSIAVGQAALVATCKGDFDAALKMGEESVRLARRADPGLIPGMSGVYHAIPLLETGQPKRAREVLLAMSGGDPGLRTSRSGWAQAYEILVRSELALGNIEGAEAWAGRAEALPAAGELAAETAIIRRTSAAVELARGRRLRAADLAFDGAQRAGDSGSPLEAGRCRILGAQALLEANHIGRARHELEQAARELRRMGADHYLSVATRQLGKVSGGYVVPDERDLPQGAWDTLTPTERAIVDLVAQGLTNPEVAARLFVSRSTVKHHLARVMDKTGLDSRVKLAREASRRG